MRVSEYTYDLMHCKIVFGRYQSARLPYRAVFECDFVPRVLKIINVLLPPVMDVR